MDPEFSATAALMGNVHAGANRQMVYVKRCFNDLPLKLAARAMRPDRPKWGWHY
jgi:hypothetical protein